MFRGFRKDIKLLGPHMIVNATKSFQSLYSIEINCKIPPPSEPYCKIFLDHYPQTGNSAKALLAYTIQAWVISQTTVSEHKETIKGFLKAGCILALAENGLGAISWTLKAARSLHVDVGTYLLYCMVTSSMETQVARIHALLKNKDRGNTWPFCRLFQESALCDLSNDKCPELSIIGALLSMETYRQAEDLQQFSKLRSLFPSMREYADVLRDLLRPSIPDSAVTSEGLLVVQAIQRNKAFRGGRGRGRGNYHTQDRQSLRIMPHSSSQRYRDEEEEDEISSKDSEEEEYEDPAEVIARL